MDTTDSKGVAPPPPRQAAATPVSAAMSALDLAAVAGAAANPGDESKVYIKVTQYRKEIVPSGQKSETKKFAKIGRV